MERKKHPFLILFFAIVVILAIGLIVRGCILSRANPDNSDGNTSITRRSANINDINIVNFELDINSLSGEYTLLPQVDINDLSVRIDLYDNNNNLLYSTNRTIGNVVKGVQTNFSISLFEVGLKAVLIERDNLTITGGTVSNFSF